MPYINKERRKVYGPGISELLRQLSTVSRDKLDGDINYIITRILKSIYPPNYFNLNRAVGVIECAKQEFYRRVVAPYEDQKRKEWGDVYYA